MKNVYRKIVPYLATLSEILSILLQNEPDNRRALVELTGVSSPMDSMLQQLAFYKRHNPKTAEGKFQWFNSFKKSLIVSPYT